MHHRHLAPCLVVAGLAVAAMIGLGVGPTSLLPFSIFLLCPLVMGGMVWWMIQGSRAGADRGDPHEHPSSFR